jgi:hypothetical protein
VYASFQMSYERTKTDRREHKGVDTKSSTYLQNQKRLPSKGASLL